MADDHPLYREAVVRAVRARPEFELIGQAADGRAALGAIRASAPDIAVLDVEMPSLGGVDVVRAVAELEPDLVILDLRMPDLDGIGVLRALHAQDPPPDCRVVLISATLDDAVQAEAMAAGADACLSKAETRADICRVGLRLVAR